MIAEPQQLLDKDMECALIQPSKEYHGDFQPLDSPLFQLMPRKKR